MGWGWGWGLGMGLESELRLGLELGRKREEGAQRTRLVLVMPPRVSQYALPLVRVRTELNRHSRKSSE